jgi:hypothetical protein
VDVAFYKGKGRIGGKFVVLEGERGLEGRYRVKGGKYMYHSLVPKPLFSYPFTT